MNGVREFNRLQDRPEALSVRNHFCRSAAQRSGQRNGKMVQAYPHILYISCNPETLCKNRNVKPDAHGVSPGAIRSVPVYTSYGMRYYSPQGKMYVGWPVIPPSGLRTLLCGVLLAVTQLKANPEYQNHRQHRREEIRTNIRIFCTHHGAIQ